MSVSRQDIVTSSIYRKFLIAYSLMAVVPLLVFGYFVSAYIMPALQTVENLVFVTVLTVFIACVGFFMMREILISFLLLKKYTHNIAREELISVGETPGDADLNEMVVSLNRIISYLLENEDKLRHQRDELQARYNEIQQLGSVKDGLVRMLAHDVRNFIMLISANVELFSDEALGDGQERRRKYLRGLKYSVESLRHMIDNMLYIEKMESGERHCSWEVLDLGRLSNDCLMTVRDIFEAERKVVVSRVDERPLMVRVDRDLMSRVIWNLLWNADQHTAEGGTISLAVRADAGGEKVFMSVSDDGEGIPEGIRERIFEKFFQGQTAKGRKGAAGLGLAFCGIAVALHGGTIAVESKEGRGSTFSVCLPLEDSSQVAAAR